MDDSIDIQSTINRRSVLMAGALATTSTSGCIQRVRTLTERNPVEPISLTIKTPPADDDPYAIRIAQRLAEHLASVGITVEVIPMRNDQVLGDVLVDQDYDLYVGVHPGGIDPNFLYPLLHSRYSTEPGWQNPFGFTDLATDDLLEQQRQLTGKARNQTVAQLQRVLAKKQPFSIVAMPDAIRVIRQDRFGGWRSVPRSTPIEYLDLRWQSEEDQTTPSGDQPADEHRTLRVALTDGRATRNLNPIAVTFRNRGTITDLLYDPPARSIEGELVPWMAESWEWDRRVIRPGPVLIVRLRDDCRWHDGHQVTANDVAFTYRFLADTSLGREEQPVPAPRFREITSMVETVEILDERRVQLEFTNIHPSVAYRSLTIPILPDHEWRPRTGPAEFVGLDLLDGTTEALVWRNMDPIGSGPLRFRRAVKDESLILDRFDEHFAWESVPGDPENGTGKPRLDRLAIRIVPSAEAAIELLTVGEIDATGRRIDAHAVATAVRSKEVRPLVSSSPAFYHLGFNTRRAPLSNPRFRRVIARLIDRAYLVAEVFNGYARPAVSPLAQSKWLAPDLDVTSQDSVLPFFGEAGQLDGDMARQAFEQAGYRYDSSDNLVRG